MGTDPSVDPLSARPRRGLGRELGEALIVALVLALFARTFLVQAFEIPSGSMEPNLLIGDHVLVNKFVYGQAPPSWLAAVLPYRAVDRGDVVIFRYPLDPRRDFVKRCVAVPGDRLGWRDDRLVINGHEVDERGYAHLDPRPGRRTAADRGERMLGQELYCLGDNRDASNDSRAWGPVPLTAVKGRALLVYWSVSEPSARGASARATLLDHPGRWLTATRWRRSMTVVR